MKQGLDILEVEEGDVRIVSLSGAVDSSSAMILRSKVGPMCMEQGARIVLDCSGLTYLNSMCMGQFAAFDKSCTQCGGKLVLCGLEGTILDVMKLLKLDKILTLCDSQEDALVAVG